MFPIAFILSLVLGVFLSIVAQSGVAIILGFLYLFPVIFLIGLILMMIGVVRVIQGRAEVKKYKSNKHT